MAGEAGPGSIPAHLHLVRLEDSPWENGRAENLLHGKGHVCGLLGVCMEVFRVQGSPPSPLAGGGSGSIAGCQTTSAIPVTLNTLILADEPRRRPGVVLPDLPCSRGLSRGHRNQIPY